MLVQLPQAWGYFDNGGPADVPTELAAEITDDCFVTKVEICNPTDAPITVEVRDGNGVLLIPPKAVPNTEMLTYTADMGRRMTGGVWWKASAPGCIGYVRGVLLPTGN